MNIKPSYRIRPLFRRLNQDKIEEAIRLIKIDIAELEKEKASDYPSIVRDAIQDTLDRYTYDLGYLERRLARLQRK